MQAETLEAIRNGCILAAGDSGLKLNELYPQRYARPAPHVDVALADVAVARANVQ